MPLPSGGDYDLDAGLAGLAFRQELNTLILALLSLSANSSLPPETVAFMLRADTAASPNELQLRNPSDAAFLKIAEVTDTDVTLFSDGAAVPSLGTAQTFTEAQAVDQAGSSGLLSVGSDQSSGVVARVPMFGHNSAASDVTGVNLVCRVNTNTAGAEDFSFEVEVVRGGSTVTVANIGTLSDFRRSGGGGTLDADIVRQAGVELSTIINNETGRLGTSGVFDFSGARALTQADQGRLLRFNGASATVVTVPILDQNTVVYIVNDGTANVTFTSAANPNNVTFRTTRLTLPPLGSDAPMCALVWFQALGDTVNIVGQNT